MKKNNLLATTQHVPKITTTTRVIITMETTTNVITMTTADTVIADGSITQTDHTIGHMIGHMIGHKTDPTTIRDKNHTIGPKTRTSTIGRGGADFSYPQKKL